MFKANNNEIVEVDSKADKIFKILFKSKKLKSKKFQNLTYLITVKKPMFLTFNTKKTFNHLG